VSRSAEYIALGSDADAWVALHEAVTCHTITHVTQ
jgi:hypothetical protein